MSLLSFFGSGRAQQPKMKTINYGDGVVEFRIPASWKEDYSDTDSAVFYADKPNSGTFRLHLVTAIAASEVASDSAAAVLNTVEQARGQPEILPSGNALAKREQSTVDRGQKIKVFYWFVANVVPPRHARIATFSYTILENREGKPLVAQELQMLDQEIRAAEFSAEIGTTLSADRIRELR